MEIGSHLKALRVQKGLTQEELAERTDLSKGYISQLENDLSSPSMDTFFDILEVLGCAPKDFFEDGPEEALTVYGPEDMTIMEDRKVQVKVGKQIEVVSKGESFYFEASAKHQIKNAGNETSKVLIVATNSYL